jgi:hypothetical protein
MKLSGDLPDLLSGQPITVYAKQTGEIVVEIDEVEIDSRRSLT